MDEQGSAGLSKVRGEHVIHPDGHAGAFFAGDWTAESIITPSILSILGAPQSPFVLADLRALAGTRHSGGKGGVKATNQDRSPGSCAHCIGRSDERIFNN